MATTPDLASARARIAALLPGLRQQYAVRSLFIFGSYARGEQTPESDLDVLVEFDETPDLFELVGLGLDLGDALGVRVDVVMRDGVKPHALPSVLRDLVPI